MRGVKSSTYFFQLLSDGVLLCGVEIWFREACNVNVHGCHGLAYLRPCAPLHVPFYTVNVLEVQSCCVACLPINNLQ